MTATGRWGGVAWRQGREKQGKHYLRKGENKDLSLLCRVENQNWPEQRAFSVNRVTTCKFTRITSFFKNENNFDRRVQRVLPGS
jgi:hypothetical protein